MKIKPFILIFSFLFLWLGSNTSFVFAATSLERFLSVQEQYESLDGPAIEQFAAALSQALKKTFVDRPVRGRFFVANTLNPTVWPMGNGFFIVHAGLLHWLESPQELAFVLGLELAHSTLGTSLDQAGFSWSTLRDDIDFWAMRVAVDPLAKQVFVYTEEQELLALRHVAGMFTLLGFDFESFRKNEFPKLYERLRNLSGATFYTHLHPKLADQLKRPVAEVSAQTRSTGFRNNSTVAGFEPLIKVSEAPLAPLLSGQQLGVIFEKALAQVKINPFQQFPWLLSFGKNQYHQLAPENSLPNAKLARWYADAKAFQVQHNWKSMLEVSSKALQIDPQAEPFLLLRARAKVQLGQFKGCAADLAEPWLRLGSFFDRHRERSAVECVFLEGMHSSAAQMAEAYFKKYPQDIDAGFWDVLIQLYLRRPVEARIDALELKFGPRPAVLALKIIYFGYVDKMELAVPFMNFEDLRGQYPVEEIGKYEFARTWLKAAQHYGDLEKSIHLSELKWPLAKQLRKVLILEPTRVE